MPLNDLLGVGGQIGVSNQIGVPKSVGGFTSAFPGLNEGEIQSIYDQTSNLSGQQRTDTQKKLYKNKIRENDFNDYMDERNQSNMAVLRKISPVNSSDADVADKTQAFAGYLRSRLYELGKDYKKDTDKELLNDTFTNVPGLKDQFTNRLNGKQPLLPREMEEKEKEAAKPLLEKVGEGMLSDLSNAKNVFGAAVAETPKTISNIGEGGAKINPMFWAIHGLSKIAPNWIEDPFAAADKMGVESSGVKDEAQKFFGVDKDALPTKISEFIVDNLPTAILPTGKIAESVPGMANLAKNAPKTYNFVKGLLEGALITQGSNISSEGKPAGVGDTLVGAGIGGGMSALGDFGSLLKKTNKSEDDIKNIVGKIIQGGTEDVSTAQKALGEVDTSGVKTYKDLLSRFKDREKTLAESQNDYLSQFTKNFTPQETTITTQVGKNSVNTNYIEKALNNLEELYTKNSDDVALAKIKDLKDKFNNEGFTIKDINDLAKEYGVNKSGFSDKTGTPLTSVTSQGYENVRKGLKTTLRNQLPDDTSRLLDEKYSNVANTKILVDKMNEKVNALQQKIKKRGLLEKIGRSLGRGIDIVSGGSIRGFLTSFLPSNVGNKVMNSIDLENQLPKLLKQIDKIDKAVDVGKASKISSLISEYGDMVKDLGKKAVIAGTTEDTQE